jgi:hypothetical protein
MELDIIEIRAYNYFHLNRKLIQIDEKHLATISVLLSQLKPIEITPITLSRLNFVSVYESEKRMLQKYYKNIYFGFHRLKNDKLLLIINNELKLPHIIYIHQLQNLYYDLVGDVLKLPVIIYRKQYFLWDVRISDT